jgi:small subunit ribosomal protein YMR-31
VPLILSPAYHQVPAASESKLQGSRPFVLATRVKRTTIAAFNRNPNPPDIDTLSCGDIIFKLWDINRIGAVGTRQYFDLSTDKMFSRTRVLRAAVAAAHHERTPMIKFIGKRTIPCKPWAHNSELILLTSIASIDHSPRPHPVSPTKSLPEGFGSASSSPSSSSFSSYRDKAQQHGPLGRANNGAEKSVAALSGHALGPVVPEKGQYFDRNELPARFRRTPLTAAEIDAIETGGATLVC